MKKLKRLGAVFTLVFMLGGMPAAQAQCAMCGTVAESSTKNGQTEGNKLNNGIMYLLAAPYLAIAGIGMLWYKRYRKKNVQLDMRDEKINLN